MLASYLVVLCVLAVVEISLLTLRRVEKRLFGYVRPSYFILPSMWVMAEVLCFIELARLLSRS